MKIRNRNNPLKGFMVYGALVCVSVLLMIGLVACGE